MPDQICECQPALGRLVGWQLPLATNCCVHEFHVHVVVEQNDTLLHMVEGGAQLLTFVSATNDVGHIRVAQHASASGQRGALKADDVTAGETQVDRPGVTFANVGNSLLDVGVQCNIGHGVSMSVAPVIQQRHEGWPAVRRCVWQSPHGSKGTVDEPRAQTCVEKDDAQGNFVQSHPKRQEVAAQRRRGRGASRCRRAFLGRVSNCRPAERYAHLVLGLPDHVTTSSGVFAFQNQVEESGHADGCLDLKIGSLSRQIAYGACDHRLLVVEQDLAAFQAAAALYVATFLHDQHRTWERTNSTAIGYRALKLACCLRVKRSRVGCDVQSRVRSLKRGADIGGLPCDRQLPQLGI